MSLDVGIDFTKPWEEISMYDYYQIEYLLIGKLKSKSENYIPDHEIGINVFEENRFGQGEFESNNVLNLTLIISK